MRTKTINVYSFEELSDKAKKKVIEKFYDINTDYDWYELTNEEQCEELVNLGYNEPKILFSGFASQGDGACFTCTSIDFQKFMGGKYKDVDISANITHSWRYYFATSTTVNLEDNGNLSQEQYDEIEKDIENEREQLGNKFYRQLEKEYYALTSEKAIIETIEANEYEFDEDGNMI